MAKLTGRLNWFVSLPCVPKCDAVQGKYGSIASYQTFAIFV